jgi:hypothetical protein
MGTFGTAEITVNNGQPMPGELNIEYQIIDVTSSTATKPAMSWTVIDDQGHFHAYDDKGELPTLIARGRHIECDGSCGGVCEGEGYDIVEYFCAICGQQIEPERVSDTGPKSIPGRMMWEARVQPEQQITGKVTVRIATGDKTLFGVAEARTDAWSTGPNPVAFSTRLYGIGPLGERRG